MQNRTWRGIAITGGKPCLSQSGCDLQCNFIFWHWKGTLLCSNYRKTFSPTSYYPHHFWSPNLWVFPHWLILLRFLEFNSIWYYLCRDGIRPHRVMGAEEALNMPLWHGDSFEMFIFERLQKQAKLWKHSRSYLWEGNLHLQGESSFVTWSLLTAFFLATSFNWLPTSQYLLLSLTGV